MFTIQIVIPGAAANTVPIEVSWREADEAASQR
jgi:hypothetical protein